MSDSPHVIDVDEAGFLSQVIERSHEVPVVVDLWAEWCGPCRTLGPMIEAAVAARDGEVVLAKVDVDANPGIAQSLRVQGIPQVVAFKDGKTVSQFTGVIPQPQLDAFLDDLAPTAADRAVVLAADLPPEDAEVELSRALESEPDHLGVAVALAKLVVERDPDLARELVAAHRPDPSAEAVITQASLASDGHGDVDALRARVADEGGDGALRLALGRALAARGEHDEALEHLLAAVEAGGETKDDARELLVGLFGILGDDPRVPGARARLSRALF